MRNLLKNKYLALKNVLKIFFVKYPTYFCLTIGVAFLLLGMFFYHTYTEYGGIEGLGNIITFDMLLMLFAFEAVLIFCVVGINACIAIYKFYIKNREIYKYLPVTRRQVFTMELLHVTTLTILLLIGGISIFLFFMKISIQLIAQLYLCILMGALVNIVFPMLGYIWAVAITKKQIPFYLYLILAEAFFTIQNYLLYAQIAVWLFVVLFIAESLMGIYVLKMIHQGRFEVEFYTLRLRKSGSDGKERRCNGQMSLARVIMIEGIRNYQYLIQFLLIPIIMSLVIRSLDMVYGMKFIVDYLAFIPCFFAGLYISYEKEYQQLPIRRRENIWIRLAMGLVLMSMVFVLTTWIIGTGASWKEYLAALFLAIFLFSMIYKLRIPLISIGKENPLLYLILAGVILIYQFLNDYIAEAGFLLTNMEMPVYFTAMILGIAGGVALLVKE